MSPARILVADDEPDMRTLLASVLRRAGYEVEQAKDWYYAMAGWDVATGTPTREKLEELELGWVAEILGQ